MGRQTSAPRHTRTLVPAPSWSTGCSQLEHRAARRSARPPVALPVPAGAESAPPLMLETVASTAQTGRNSGQGARHSATLSSPAWLGARGLDGPGRGGGLQREAVVTSVAGGSAPERGVARCWAVAGAASCGRRTAPRRQLPASSARSAAGLDQCPPASRRGSAARFGRTSRRAAGRVASAWNEGSSRSWTARRSASCQTCTEDRNGIASKRLGEAGSTTRPWHEDTRRIAL